MFKIRRSGVVPGALGVCVFLVSLGAVYAQSLDTTIQAEENINQQSAQSQTRVSGLANQTQIDWDGDKRHRQRDDRTKQVVGCIAAYAQCGGPDQREKLVI